MNSSASTRKCSHWSRNARKLRDGLLQPMGDSPAFRNLPGPDGIGSEKLGASREVATRPLGVDASHALDVLLRHRLASISQEYRLQCKAAVCVNRHGASRSARPRAVAALAGRPHLCRSGRGRRRPLSQSRSSSRGGGISVSSETSRKASRVASRTVSTSSAGATIPERSARRINTLSALTSQSAGSATASQPRRSQIFAIRKLFFWSGSAKASNAARRASSPEGPPRRPSHEAIRFAASPS